MREREMKEGGGEGNDIRGVWGTYLYLQLFIIFHDKIKTSKLGL